MRKQYYTRILTDIFQMDAFFAISQAILYLDFSGCIPKWMLSLLYAQAIYTRILTDIFQMDAFFAILTSGQICHIFIMLSAHKSKNLTNFNDRQYILHNVRFYHTALVKHIWLALCSQVTRKF